MKLLPIFQISTFVIIFVRIFVVFKKNGNYKGLFAISKHLLSYVRRKFLLIEQLLHISYMFVKN